MSEAAKKVAPIRADLNIYQRINEVRKKVWYARKDKEVQGQGYKAVTHDAVTALVRNHLIEQGVLIVPRLMGSEVTEIGKTKSGAPVIRYAARFEIDFVNCDSPEDRITLPAESHANDHGDKAPGKAVSYATKYAILKLFSIETGEDEESRVEPYGGAETITAEQVADLQSLIEEVGVEMPKFLKWARVTSLDQIHKKAYAECVRQVERKRKQ